MQERINKILLSPVILPTIFRSVRYRSIIVMLNASGAKLLLLWTFAMFSQHYKRACLRVWAISWDAHLSSQVSSKLTTFNRHLPQGAPTSPVSPIYSFGQWTKRSEILARLGIAYSTWIDDLAFSGEKARNVIQDVVAMFKQSGLRLSHKKSRSWVADNLRP